ncbi:diaminopimelate decarboxylase [Desulfonema magnum]|uniref:Diaminopimelate decarboxylase family protein n=1 Tax=Desulfonema magnum TaxID=45655 RepID=A0A975GKS8_9BACT|nr:diaminopimelate decarboxylase [Desulfonema magnum]QTA84987.1 Diaminopimelate decarboxylase family protein [Desulfonema magnum]
MPMSETFKDRLFPVLKDITKHFGTPFHIYDEIGIRETGQLLIDGFSEMKGFREYFAVKALPNPRILEIMRDMGFGFDCSSIAELLLSRQTGARGEDLMFTSNNTSIEEFQVAGAEGGGILNLDDITLIPKVPEMPALICFRYNPGPRCDGNEIIGDPAESKYGVSHEQVTDAYRMARDLGAKRFGLHTMVVSNELNYIYKVQVTRLVLEVAERVTKELGIKFEFINMGGGLGIPYKPEDSPLDLHTMAAEITELFNQFKKRNGYMPKLYLESGRYMTGPHGALVVKAINQKDIYRKYIGVDACMSALMRPALYGAYHHISVLGKDSQQDTEIVDVVGSLCENNDKFAIQRTLPKTEEGDILIIHDTGAHGHAMGFNYNGKLRPKELLLRTDGSVELIRREETVDDYFATLSFEPNTMMPGKA